MTSFAAMLGLSGLCLLLLPHAGNAALFFVLAAVVYLCYGGGFGTMPATAGRLLRGQATPGAIYGLMLIGWSLGGIIGPLIASALIGDDGNYTAAYTDIGHHRARRGRPDVHHQAAGRPRRSDRWHHRRRRRAAASRGRGGH